MLRSPWLLSLALLTACDSPGRQIPAAVLECQDGVMNGAETAVDCGGACAPCGDGSACAGPNDCVSRTCEANVCAAGPRCDDGVKNGTETGLDCGGTCGGCPAGAGCAIASDCLGGSCSNEVCAAPSTCSDAALSPGETDVDCGGACPPCASSKTCKVNGDCLTNICTFGVCRDPSCTDALKNQGETDVDCGGPCGDCAVGKACGAASDCQGARCEGGLCASCTDGRKSGAEVGQDCGGPCEPCATGVACTADTQCQTGRCDGGVCGSCSDGKKNGDETDVDCGGRDCGGSCPDGDVCRGDSDCRNDSCEGGACRSCFDGKKNGEETGLDCGYVACNRDCPDLQGCTDDRDCASDRCVGGQCVSCTDGKKNADETGVDCGGSSCPDCALGGTCAGNWDCAEGICDGGKCCTPNRCGDACGPLATEVCNGVDDDCDGNTDTPLDEGPLCPKQAGVCAGSRTTCNGGTYRCDDVRYDIHDPLYQPVETVCDGLDNDCDGQIDEGLLNACGGCGAVGAEVCDGRDNDCDDQIDEVPGCLECKPTPTVVTFGPRSGTTFGGPPQPGTFLAKRPGSVWSVHSEPLTDKNRLYVTRFSGGAATSTMLNEHATSPTFDFDDEHMVIMALADFGNTALRAHYVDLGATPSSAGIIIARASTTVPVLRHRVLLDYPDSYYIEVKAQELRAYDGDNVEGDWLGMWDLPVASEAHVYHSVASQLDWRAILNRNDGLIVQGLVYDERERWIGPKASSLEVSSNLGGTVAIFDVDATTGVVRAWYRGVRDQFTTGASPFPGNLRFLGADVVHDGPIVALGLDSSGRLVAAVSYPGVAGWSTTTYEGIAGISTAAQTEVSVDSSGRMHVLAELAGATPSRAYFMACPTCPNGSCAGPSGPIVINELLYDTVGADNDVFIELRGAPGQSLDGYTIVGIGGDTGNVYRTVTLSGTIPSSGLYLVATSNGNATLQGKAQLIASVDFQNGPDGVALRAPDGATVDALAYAASGAAILPIGEGTPALAVTAGQSLGRTGGVDTNDNAADFKAQTPTPGAPN